MKVLRPMKAIRAKCVECSGGNRAEVRQCEIEDCPLWPYRLGRRPKKQAKEVNDVTQGRIFSRQTPSRLADLAAN
jgi:hypothetical protein